MTGTFLIRAYYAGNQSRSIYLVETASNQITITITSGGVANGKITTIQVKDITRNILYTWTDPSRVWNATPSVVPGAGNIWIMANATNIGTATGNLTVKITNASTGAVLATITVPTAIGGSTGVVWTGDMPNANLQLAVSVTP